MADNIKKAYDALSKDYNVGTESEFRKNMSDPKKRKIAYDALSKNYNVGTLKEFEQSIGFGADTSVAVIKERGLFAGINKLIGNATKGISAKPKTTETYTPTANEQQAVDYLNSPDTTPTPKQTNYNRLATNLGVTQANASGSAQGPEVASGLTTGNPFVSPAQISGIEIDTPLGRAASRANETVQRVTDEAKDEARINNMVQDAFNAPTTNAPSEDAQQYVGDNLKMGSQQNFGIDLAGNTQKKLAQKDLIPNWQGSDEQKQYRQELTDYMATMPESPEVFAQKYWDNQKQGMAKELADMKETNIAMLDDPEISNLFNASVIENKYNNLPNAYAAIDEQYAQDIEDYGIQYANDIMRAKGMSPTSLEPDKVPTKEQYDSWVEEGRNKRKDELHSMMRNGYSDIVNKEMSNDATKYSWVLSYMTDNPFFNSLRGLARATAGNDGEAAQLRQQIYGAEAEKHPVVATLASAFSIVNDPTLVATGYAASRLAMIPLAWWAGRSVQLAGKAKPAFDVLFRASQFSKAGRNLYGALSSGLGMGTWMGAGAVASPFAYGQDIELTEVGKEVAKGVALGLATYGVSRFVGNYGDRWVKANNKRWADNITKAKAANVSARAVQHLAGTAGEVGVFTASQALEEGQ